MATATKIFFRGDATTTLSTLLYSVPAMHSAVITNMAITNTTAQESTFTIYIDDVELQSETALPANVTAYIDIKQVLAAGGTIKGGASAAGVKFHISGVEIS